MSSVSSKSEATIRVLPFSGKKTEWIACEAKVLAKANLKGWKAILIGTEKSPTDEELKKLDPAVPDDALKIKFRENNDTAYMELLLSMETTTPSGEVAFDIVLSSTSDKFINGNAKLAYDNLKKKYAPQTAPTLVKLSKEFYQTSLDRGSDPDLFISKMERLRTRIKQMDPNSNLSDKQFIVVLLNNLSDDYELQVSMLERRLDDDKIILTVEDVRDELNLRFERLGVTNPKGSKPDVERALVFKNKYKGKCNSCGKIGHMSKDCWAKNGKPGDNKKAPEQKKNSNYKSDKKFTGKCNFCGLVGHKEVDCRKKKSAGTESAGIAEEKDIMLIMHEPFVFESDEESDDSTHYRLCDELYEEQEMHKKNDPFSANSDFFDDWNTEYCMIAMERPIEDDDDVDQDMSASAQERLHDEVEANMMEAVLEYDAATENAVQEVQANEREEMLMQVAQPPRSLEQEQTSKKFNIGAKKHVAGDDIDDDDLSDDDYLSDGQILTKLEIQRLSFRNFTETNGKWKNMIDIQFKQMMYDNLYERHRREVRQGAIEGDPPSELVRFFGMLAVKYFKIPPEQVDVYAHEMTARLYQIGVKTVNTLLQNVWRLPILLPNMSRPKFSPYVCDAIAYYGVEWVRLTAKYQAQQDVENGRNAIHEYMSPPHPGSWLTLSAQRRAGLEGVPPGHGNQGNDDNDEDRATIRNEQPWAKPKWDTPKDSKGWHVHKLKQRTGANIPSEGENSSASEGHEDPGHVDTPRKRKATRVKPSTVQPSENKTGSDEDPNPDIAKKDSEDSTNYEFALVASEKKRSHMNSYTWVLDTGASCHVATTLDGMVDLRDEITRIIVGNNDEIISYKVGTKILKVLQQDGKTTIVKLDEVKYFPKASNNLLSVAHLLHNGYSISNKGSYMSIEKHGTKITFDKFIKTSGGSLLGIDMIPIKLTQDIQIELAMLAKATTVTKIDVNMFHRTLGHPSFASTRLTAKSIGVILTGNEEPCMNCAIAKAQQKKIVSSTRTKAKMPGERLSFDISSVQANSVGGAKYWLLILDEATDYVWSRFLKTKDLLAWYMILIIQELNSKRRPVKYLRCDNAGENISLHKTCQEKYPDIQFEFTSPGTPQQNGAVERKFATLYGMTRASLNAAELPEITREYLWAESANHSTDMVNIIVTPNDQVSAFHKMYGKNKKGIDLMHPFGELAIVTDHSKKKIRSKLCDRGFVCLNLGPAPFHGHDCFRLYRLDTKYVIMSRDIKWMGKFYGEWKGIKGSHRIIDDDDDEYHDPDHTNDAVPVEDQQLAPAVNPKAARELRRLGAHNLEPASANQQNSVLHTGDGMLTRSRAGKDNRVQWSGPHPHPPPPPANEGNNVLAEREDIPPQVETVDEDEEYEIIEEFPSDNDDVEEVNFHAEQHQEEVDWEEVRKLSPTMWKDKIEIPKNFNEAWNHPIPWIRKFWRDAISKEHRKMEVHKVFKLVQRCNIPQGRRCIKFRWIFEIKRNGTFRARLVACGYSQIAGVDFNDVYSPVVNDIGFRITVVIQIVCGYGARVMDIETAFLNGTLEEEIYMEVPDGMRSQQGQVVLIQKSLYGLVQSARQFNKKLNEVLKAVGFIQCLAEPCLWYRKGVKGFVMMVVHVDDCYAVGDDLALDEAIDLIESKGLKLKVEANTQDYLSCEIKFNENKTGAWMGQPHLLRKIIKGFGKLTKTGSKYKTPGTPGIGLIRPKEDDVVLPETQQQVYRSAVGTLLHLIKYSRPDIANPVRELSKCGGVADTKAFQEMNRVLKFVIDTSDYGLRMYPEKLIGKKYVLTAYSDSDWAGDKDTRHSVTGFVILLMGVPIMWKSKSQRSISLSSSEAEFYAISEAAKDIKFVYQILTSIGLEVELPIKLMVDNIGAIFMSENVSATSRTKHVDIRYHYVREFVEEGFLKIEFVRSAENKSDMFTKNISSDIYDAHINEFIIAKDDIK